MHDFADQYQRGPDYRPGGKRYWGRQFKCVVCMPNSVHEDFHLRAKLANLSVITLYSAPPSRTVGNLVIFLCCAIGGLELAVLVLIMRM